MSQSLAFLINDRQLLPCLCRLVGPELEPLHSPATAHMGVGFYDQGEVLLSRRPVSAQSAFHDLCRNASNCVIGHIEEGAVKEFRTVRAQPFRYKDWLWTQSGGLQERPGFDRQALAVPTYILENIHTWQPGEVVFHLFLAFLHAAGMLGKLHWNRITVRKALASALSLVEAHYESTEPGEKPRYSVLATNGEMLVGVGVGRPLFVRRVNGIEACALCAERRKTREEKPVSHPHFRAVLLLDARPGTAEGQEGGLPPGWEELPVGQFADVDGSMAVETGPFPF